MLLKNEFKSIISGTGFVTKGTAIQAVANYLRKSKQQVQSLKKKSASKIRKQQGTFIKF